MRCCCVALLPVLLMGLPGSAAGQAHPEHPAGRTVGHAVDDRVPATAGWGLSVLGVGYLTGVMPGVAVHLPLGGGGNRPGALSVWASPFPDEAGWAAAGDVTWRAGAFQLGLGLVAVRDGSDTLFGPGMFVGAEWFSSGEGLSTRYGVAYRAYTPGGGLPMLSLELGLVRLAR